MSVANAPNSVLGLSRIRKYPERFNYLRRSFLRTAAVLATFTNETPAATTVVLNWTHTDPDPESAGMIVERQLKGSSVWTEIASLPGTTLTTTATDLSAETQYTFRAYLTRDTGRSYMSTLQLLTAAA